LTWEARANGRTRRLHREPEAGFARRLLAGIVRFLPIESQL
jgi:putative cardiolipin synthase